MINNNKDKATNFLQEESLRSNLQAILGAVDLSNQRGLLRAVAADLEVDIVDCAAALIHLHQSHFQIEESSQQDNSSDKYQVGKESELKMIRYRLEVGRKHQISVEILKNILVEESGVEKKLIGYIDIHNHYTLVKLPVGMPAEIFNHLKVVQIHRQALAIKRLGRNRHKSKRQRNSATRESSNSASKKQNKRLVKTSDRVVS